MKTATITTFLLAGSLLAPALAGCGLFGGSDETQRSSVIPGDSTGGAPGAGGTTAAGGNASGARP
jgi:hypothetical protein